MNVKEYLGFALVGILCIVIAFIFCFPLVDDITGAFFGALIGLGTVCLAEPIILNLILFKKVFVYDL